MGRGFYQQTLLWQIKRSERKHCFFHSFLLYKLCLKSINRLSNASRLISIRFYIFAPIRIFVDCKYN